MRGSGLSLEGRCTLVENVYTFEIISVPRKTVGVLSSIQIISWQAPKAQIEDKEFERNVQRMVRISVILEQRCLAEEDGHFARTLLQNDMHTNVSTG